MLSSCFVRLLTCAVWFCCSVMCSTLGVEMCYINQDWLMTRPPLRSNESKMLHLTFSSFLFKKSHEFFWSMHIWRNVSVTYKPPCQRDALSFSKQVLRATVELLVNAELQQCLEGWKTSPDILPARGWVDADCIFIFGWTVPLRSYNHQQ